MPVPGDGLSFDVVVEGNGADVERLAELAMIRIARLEASWSRFLPDSDVSRINRGRRCTGRSTAGHGDAAAGDGRGD